MLQESIIPEDDQSAENQSCDDTSWGTVKCYLQGGQTARYREVERF